MFLKRNFRRDSIFECRRFRKKVKIRSNILKIIYRIWRGQWRTINMPVFCSLLQKKRSAFKSRRSNGTKMSKHSSSCQKITLSKTCIENSLRNIALRNTNYVTNMNSIIAIIYLASFTFMQLPTATWLIFMKSTYAAKPSSLLTYLPTQEII